ncbi:hypothetical protein MMC14_006788 [Varicellaria rhodocarpa]|nr:hypothetical protein [Varicellaria rhodocarpa]
MAIAFNINAGPLTQIGINLLSVDTAVQLALGAYGWYKAKGRSKSLIGPLSASGAELVSTSSFNREHYLESRSQEGVVRGLVIQNGIAQSTTLPKASTAVPQHPGLICLRALTTGILCFYGSDACTAILANVIPFALLQYHQQDSDIDMAGPAQSSLKQFVDAIAIEEDANTYRTFLLQQASNRQFEITGAPLSEILDCDFTHEVDLPLAIGFLRWMLTPVHKRDHAQYPTRSLLVWAMAVTMKHVGFEVSASLTFISSATSYEQILGADRYIDQYPEAILVTTSAGLTDFESSVEVPQVEDDGLRPQITPMRGIPWLAFRHLRGSISDVNTQLLVDIWMFAHAQARDSTGRPEVRNGGDFRLKPLSGKSRVISDLHSQLLRPFSPHLDHICGPAMSQYVPIRSNSADWKPELIDEQFRILRTEEDKFQLQPALRENCYILISIILGTIYGVVSRACRDDNNDLNLDSEVAFLPNIIYGSKLKKWASFIGLALSGSIYFKDWNSAVLEIVLGIKATSQGSQVGLGNARLTEKQARSGMSLGAQGNGMAAVLDLAVKPSLRADSVAIFHIGRGLIVNLPLTDEGFIEASCRILPPMTMGLNDDPHVTTLEVPLSKGIDASMRIDIEPCWEGDPRTVVFRVRNYGAVVSSLNIDTVVMYLQHQVIHCKCTDKTRTVSVNANEKWQNVNIESLMRTLFKGISHHRADIDYKSYRVCIDATRSEAATLFAIGTLYTQNLMICDGCLKCVVQAIHAQARFGSIAIVLGAHTMSSEDPASKSIAQ